MKKTLLFIIICLMSASCVISNKPVRQPLQPTVKYKKVWYKPWYRSRRYESKPRPPRRKHH